MPADVTVRRVEPEDWAAWRDLRLEALVDTPIGFGERLAEALQSDEQGWRDRVLRGVEGASSFMALAWEHDVPVAMVGGYRDAGDGRPTVFAVFVQPRWRGRGLLDRLVDAVAAWASAEVGGDELRLEVHEDNAPAAAAYAKLGFRPDGRARPYPLDPSRQLLGMACALP